MSLKVADLHRKWSKTRTYRAAFDALEGEFELARQLIEARARAGLSQEEVARRMGTSQSAVARLESGRGLPSTRTLEKYARATNSRLKIELVPAT